MASRSADAVTMQTKNLPEYVPGLAGVPAVRSSISEIDGERGLLAYRGIPIEQLVERSSYAETSWLLIQGELPRRVELDAWVAGLRRGRGASEPALPALRAMPSTGHPMKALQAGIAVLGMTPGPEAGTDATCVLVGGLPVLIATWHRIRSGLRPVAPRDDLDAAANFLWMLTGAEPDPLASRVLDACLILHAEHTINASTFGALVTASTLADPFATVCSAAGALAGELHGGANERVLAMLRAIGAPERADAWVGARIAEGRRIMGVGHRVYRTKDPRAVILQGLAERLFARLGGTPLYDTALAVERAVADRLGSKGIHPNVDFYSGIVYDRLGIPADLFTPIFAMSRVAGWLAHRAEQLQDNKLFRPTQVYIGRSGRSFVPLAERD